MRELLDQDVSREFALDFDGVEDEGRLFIHDVVVADSNFEGVLCRRDAVHMGKHLSN